MRRTLFAAVLAAGFLVARSDTRADDAADATRRARVVATVGPARTITVGELEDRITALPPFQRATFGIFRRPARRGAGNGIIFRELGRRSHRSFLDREMTEKLTDQR